MTFRKEIKPLRNFYVLLVVLVLVLILIADWRSGYSLNTTWERWKGLLTNKTFLLVFHLFFFACYLVFVALRYLWRTFKNHGWEMGIQRALAHVFLPLGILVLGYHGIVGCNTLESYDFAWDNSVENTSGTPMIYTVLTESTEE